MKKEEVLLQLKELHNDLKKDYVTDDDIKNIPKLKFYVWKHFRKLGVALKEAGLPCSPLASSMMLRDPEIIEYLRDLKDNRGHFPSVWEINNDDTVYKKYSNRRISWTLIKSRFGGLRKAQEIVEAGSKKVSVPVHIVSSQKYKPISSQFEDKMRFWGKAAEHHVMAELLYHGFQATDIPVDKGLDVSAGKDNKTFFFQVKHKNLTGGESIRLTKSSFERSGGGNVYFIFVLLTEETRGFLIVPFHVVENWILSGYAQVNEKEYLINIRKVSGHFMLKDLQLDAYLDGWDRIR